MCDCLVPEYIKEQQKVNALIEKDLRIQKKLAEKDVKMLLLGTVLIMFVSFYSKYVYGYGDLVRHLRICRIYPYLI